MECKIRKWKIDDAAELAATLNNKNIQDNLRDVAVSVGHHSCGRHTRTNRFSISLLPGKPKAICVRTTGLK